MFRFGPMTVEILGHFRIGLNPKYCCWHETRFEPAWEIDMMARCYLYFDLVSVGDTAADTSLGTLRIALDLDFDCSATRN